jgi:pimeloyl-ACP methyl ester carboxylesterase
MAANIERFKVHVENDVLDDLRARLARTRLAEPFDDPRWEYGMPVADVRALVEYWRDEYDWRAQEARLNEFEHFRTNIDGQSIHFIHVRAADDDALPLLLMHGWPGSIVEFLDAIPRLTDEFHVVVPSLPGYAFSEPTRTRGWDPARIARAFMELMTRLGYERYGAQGGDWGAQVGTRIGALDPEHCVALHLNMPLANPCDVKLTEQEQADLAALGAFRKEESGYSLEQGTKPHTLGVGLGDSPAGLLAWIVEKFRAWSDCDGNVENAFSRDHLISNVMLYWVTNTITSSMRLYRERALSNDTPEFVPVPTGVARFPKEPLRYPRSWVERSYNVTRWVDMPRGGHFAAMEQPELFADDVRTFFRTLT